MTTLAARQFLVTIDGLDGFWAQRTGAEGSADVTRVYNGGDQTAELLAGPVVYSDLVVTRPYNSARDGASMAFLIAGQGKWRTTATQVETDPNLVPMGTPPRTWQLLLTKVRAPETDAGSAAAGTIQLTFAVASAS